MRKVIVRLFYKFVWYEYGLIQDNVIAIRQIVILNITIDPDFPNQCIPTFKLI